MSETWGEPDSEDVQKWYFPVMGGILVGLAILYDPATTAIVGGAALLVRPDSPRDYIWHKGSYCIVAVVDRTFPTYKALVAQWDWTDLRTAEEVPNRCRNFLEMKPKEQSTSRPEIQPTADG